MGGNFLMALVPLMAILMRLASGATANISFLLIAIYALFGRTHAIQALALSWLFTMINPALAPEASEASIGRYLVIIAAAISVFGRSIERGSEGVEVQQLTLLTLLLGVFMLIHSLAFSAVVDVSVLKVVSWLVVVVTILAAWQGLTPVEHTLLFNQLHWGLIVLILLSIPLLTIPSIGYLRNGNGFQGFLNHPQSFGPTVALAAALVGGRVVDNTRPRWFDIALLLLFLMLIVLSSARTAGIALMLGMLGTIAMSPMFAGVPRRRMLPGLYSRRLSVALLATLACVVVAAPLLAGKLNSYLFKGSDATTLIDAADASRGVLVVRMLSNIQEHPWTGIGFGISSTPLNWELERDSIFGLPLSAPVEKGVMPLAVIEELGIFGALAVLGWILSLLLRSARAGVSQLAVIITVLFVNLGESMFFSVGGMGMLLLILTMGAATSKRRKIGTIDHA